MIAVGIDYQGCKLLLQKKLYIDFKIERLVTFIRNRLRIHY